MPEIERFPDTETGDTRPLQQLYLPFLFEAQNADGGWGYRRGGHSSVEATSWVLLALLGIQEVEKSTVEESKELASRALSLETPTGQGRGFQRHQGAEGNCSAFDGQLFDSSSRPLRAGVRWLRECQLRDGSWPSFAGQPRGCWVTAPASLALYTHGNSLDHVARGLRWLSKAWPVEGSIWRRIGAKLFRHDRLARQNESLRGWSWTPGTASWVEPTSCALIALRHIPEELHPSEAIRRRRLAERMLYDRMCPGGGWNSGNPLVYGTAGVPRIGPTVWALLALQDYRDRSENCQSLDWLERAYAQIQGPGSLALAHLCLKFHGRTVPALAPSLAVLNSNNQFLGHTLVAAWAVMALRGRPRWLTSETRN